MGPHIKRNVNNIKDFRLDSNCNINSVCVALHVILHASRSVVKLNVFGNVKISAKTTSSVFFQTESNVCDRFCVAVYIVYRF